MLFAGICAFWQVIGLLKFNDEHGGNDAWNVNMMTKYAYEPHSYSFVSNCFPIAVITNITN